MKLESIVIVLLGLSILGFAVYHGVTVRQYEKKVDFLLQESQEVLLEESEFERVYKELQENISLLEDSLRALSRIADTLSFTREAPQTLVELKESLESFGLHFDLRDTLLCTCLEGGQKIFFGFDSLKILKRKVKLYRKSLNLCQSEKKLLSGYVDSLQLSLRSLKTEVVKKDQELQYLNLKLGSARRERNLAIIASMAILGAFLLK